MSIIARKRNKYPGVALIKIVMQRQRTRVFSRTLTNVYKNHEPAKIVQILN